MSSQGLTLPEEYVNGERLAYRFLQGINFKHQETYDAII